MSDLTCGIDWSGDVAVVNARHGRGRTSAVTNDPHGFASSSNFSPAAVNAVESWLGDDRVIQGVLRRGLGGIGPGGAHD
jgi:hypothetical protein